MLIDLHSHTTASDGLLEPGELAVAAADAGIDVLGVTDHDTVDGISQARTMAGELDLEILGGIEISCFHNGLEIHILGLGIDEHANGLADFLQQLMDARVERFRAMVERLADLGVELDAEEILASTESSVGRPHVARALIEAGHVASIHEAFDRYLNRGKPAYVERFKLEARTAIERIHAAGGVAVQAHPGAMGRDTDIPGLVEAGLDGLEAFHPEHSPSARGRYEKFAQEYDLLLTGGSDFHGDDAGRATRLGQCTTAEQQFNDLQERCNRYRA